MWHIYDSGTYMWHIYDSQGQILALSFRNKAKTFSVAPSSLGSGMGGGAARDVSIILPWQNAGMLT